MLGDPGGTALDRTARMNRGHHAEGHGGRGQEHQQGEHDRRTIAEHAQEIVVDAVHRDQILKFTSRYMMKLPIPIQVPATISAVLVMSSFQTPA